jgi:hypothetical protein
VLARPLEVRLAFEQLQRTFLVRKLLAVLERQVEERPGDFADALVVSGIDCMARGR